MRWVAAVLAVALVAGAAGCGSKSDEDEAKDAVAGYVDAIVDGDGARACDHLTAEARAALVAGSARRGRRAKSCAEALDRILDRPNSGRIRRSFSQVDVQGARLEGDAGTVTIGGAAGTSDVPVRKESGDWKLTRSGR
jgi:hypothetical protein